VFAFFWEKPRAGPVRDNKAINAALLNAKNVFLLKCAKGREGVAVFTVLVRILKNNTNNFLYESDFILYINDC
jgi:hypothetical protein